MIDSTVTRMDNDNSLEAVFTFGHQRFGNIHKSYRHDEPAVYPEETMKVIQVDGDQQWPEILQKFIEFLGYVYGYNLTEKVALREDMYEYIYRDFSWTGPTFPKVEEQDEDQEDTCAGCTGKCSNCGKEDWAINL